MNPIWARWESNPHPFQDAVLSRERLPISPLAPLEIYFGIVKVAGINS